MNIYTNIKKIEKFILVIVLIILFNFCYPKNVEADLGQDIIAAPAKIFWLLEEGVLRVANNMFVKDSFKIRGSNGIIRLTPETIIKGKFLILDANIFKEVSDEDYFDYEEDANKNPIGIAKGRVALRNIISGWYYALRNFTIVALLSVLVYVGIRMIISTMAQDKAKYKTMFKDWLVALCLVVVMHYIMIGILQTCTLITNAIGTEGKNSSMLGKLTEEITMILSNSAGNSNIGRGKEPYTYRTDGTVLTLSDAYAKIIMMGGIIVYTVLFAIKYLKREFTIIFLILLGPVSCITYPIDKISDGKAQAFNKWLTEFIYQVLIQPFHLLLYLVLIGTAVELAETNILYSLVCFAVMNPAEKFVKSMFGFRDQLGSPLAAFAGGALAAKAVQALMHRGSSSSSGGKSDEKGGGSDENKLPPRTHDDKDLVGEETSDSDDSTETEENSGVHTAENSDEIENGADSESTAARLQDGTGTDEGVAEGENEEDDKPSIRERLGDKKDQLADKVKSTVRDIKAAPKNALNAIKDKSTYKKMWKSGMKNFKKMRNIHNLRMAKKYGSTSRKRRIANRVKKYAPKLLKGALKGAAIATVGGAAITASLMTGNGKEALGIASGIAAYAGSKALGGTKKAIKGATGAVKDYRNAFGNDENKEKRAFRDYEKDPEKLDRARYSYMKKHDGEDPDELALQQEMADRFSLAREGLTEDQIDDILPYYQSLRQGLLEKNAEEEGADLNKLKRFNKNPARYNRALERSLSKDAITRINEIAGAKAKQTAKLAKRYSPSDFTDPSKVKNMHSNLVRQLMESTKCSEEVAYKYAEEYIKNAAKMHGISSVQLPKLEIELPPTNIARNEAISRLASRGITNTNDGVIEQEIKIHQDLIEKGFTASDISRLEGLASLHKGGYHAVAKIVLGKSKDGDGREKAIAAFLGEGASAEDMRRENMDRLEIELITGSSDQSKITDIRKLEISNSGNDESKIREMREIASRAVKNKGIAGRDSAGITKKARKVVNKYVELGNSS